MLNPDFVIQFPCAHHSLPPPQDCLNSADPLCALLELREGHFVKVPARAGPADFQRAVEALDPAAAAAAAVGMAVRLGSVDALAEQFALLAGYVEARLAAVRPQPARAAGFAFAAARAVPRELRPQLGVPLFVDPLVRAVPGADRLLLDQCRGAADIAALRQIGLCKGRRAWMLDCGREAPAAAGASGHEAAGAVDCAGEAGQRDMQPLRSQDRADGVPAGGGGGGESGEAAAHSEPLPVPGPVAPADGAPSRESYHGRVHPDTAQICQTVRQKFGLGEGQAPPNLETLALVNRAIKRLAADLYAKDVHFILEVPANAPHSICLSNRSWAKVSVCCTGSRVEQIPFHAVSE